MTSAPATANHPPPTHHRTLEIDGVPIFYREAGSPGAPVVLLLHGWPTSSRMFRNLIPKLADRYHVISRSGMDEVSLDLLYDIRNNVPVFVTAREYFRAHQPPTLIVSGANDEIFPSDNQKQYLGDLPRAELHLLDTGHFALEDKGDEIADLIHEFLDRDLAAGAHPDE